MRLTDRKEIEVRRLLEGSPRPLPPDLAERALERGARLLRRRRLVWAALWTLFLGAVLAFSLWAALAEPWAPPPAETTPPLGW